MSFASVHAVHPGSFDPPTLGHLDLVRRAAMMFAKVTVLVARNARKTALFTPQERVALWQDVLRHDGLERVSVESWEGLTIDWCRQNDARVMIRGLRHGGDFESELPIALMNRRLAPEIETVYLPTREMHLGLTSTLVREIARLGGPVESFVSPPVVAALHRKFHLPEAG
ncbi:MAG: pantetheine-phosphate adenylyltransferase [Fibrobacteria bacterium]|nr:pantetheine-phosphate adenylyltransferase [Fibrobacteria bacterium]